VVHIEQAGSGAPVVFLHGAAGSGATYGWLPDIGRTVVRPDFRGHGLSGRADAYPLEVYVEDAVAVLRQTGPAPVVGHSLGGAVAWTVAQRHPELVTAIVLEDPPLYLGEPEEHAANAAVAHFAVLREQSARWQAEGASEAAVAAALAVEPYGPDPSRRSDEVACEDALAARAHSLLHVDAGVIDGVIDGTTLAGLDTEAPVTVPALVLAAGLGPAFAERHEARLAQTHPEVRVRRLAGAGHSIHDERAHRAAYLEAVMEWLNSAGKA
jgi:pimeloyl-ACP methyl ester carboxylesterase